MSILIWIIILLYLGTKVALLHYVMYTLTTGTSTHLTPFLPMPPTMSWCIWSAINLHTAHVFIDPTPGVPFKISMPPIPQWFELP